MVPGHFLNYGALARRNAQHCFWLSHLAADEHRARIHLTDLDDVELALIVGVLPLCIEVVK